jgi:hypothetical protein
MAKQVRVQAPIKTEFQHESAYRIKNYGSAADVTDGAAGSDFAVKRVTQISTKEVRHLDTSSYAIYTWSVT